MSKPAIERFAEDHGITLDDSLLDVARMFPCKRVYGQGMFGGKIALWLAVGGAQTIIGYGKPQEALEQAKLALVELQEQAEESIKWFEERI